MQVSEAEITRAAQEVVADLITDLRDRKGFRDLYDSVDPETKEEISATWLAFVAERLRTLIARQG